MKTLKKKKDPYGQPWPQKRSPSYKDNETPWPNLPQRLIKHIAKNPTTIRNINFSLATKSWEYSTPQQAHASKTTTHPRLIVSDYVSENTQPLPPKFCSIEFRRDYWRYWYQRHRANIEGQHGEIRFAGCSNGIFFFRGDSDSFGRLWYFFPPRYWFLMTAAELVPNVPVKSFALSTKFGFHFLDTSCVLMVVTGISFPAFTYVRLNARREWIKQDCSVLEPNCGKRAKKSSDNPNVNGLMSFTNLIGFMGKFYALSSQGTLAVIEQVGDGRSDDPFEITALGKTMAIPSIPFASFKECLIESDGGILLVLLVSKETSRKAPFEFVEVYRLRFGDLSWSKIESLGERTLFIGNDCCVSVCAEKVGCKSNCVYFLQRNHSFEAWFEFDMEFGTISRAWTDRNYSSSGNPMEWDQPIISREEMEF